MQGLRSSEVNLGVIVERMVNRLERGWTLRLPRHGEAHPHRLVVLDVRVLAHNHYLQVCVVGLVESVEDEVLWRENGLRAILGFDEAEEVAIGGTVEVLGKGWTPAT